MKKINKEYYDIINKNAEKGNEQEMFLNNLKNDLNEKIELLNNITKENEILKKEVEQLSLKLQEQELK